MRELGAFKGPIDAQVVVPGDKSLTHRGILLSALAQGDMELGQWLDAGDTRSSLALVEALGATVIEDTPARLVIRGPEQLREPDQVIDCGNSGTTMRLSCGLLTAVPGLAILTGDKSLCRRPMARVIDPLREMGVDITSRAYGLAPIVVRGGRHRGGSYRLPVASAQVKSALILSGLSADDAMIVFEPVATRDHTENLIQSMGAALQREEQRTTVYPSSLHGISFGVPSDPSSAAFWACLAALHCDSHIRMPNVLFNPTRVGFFHVLEKMGAEVEWTPTGTVPEEFGIIAVRGKELNNITVSPHEVPSMVDELPLVALLATQARGTTVVTGAEELRVKESDRIAVTQAILSAMGANVEERADGWVIEGPTPLRGTEVDARGDHRMAMLTAIAASVAKGPTYLQGEDSVAISYPTFFPTYLNLARTHSTRAGASY